MRSNMGSADRVIRLLLGLMALSLGYLYESYWGLIGLVPLLTSAFSWCPLYVPFKISTKTENTN